MTGGIRTPQLQVLQPGRAVEQPAPEAQVGTVQFVSPQAPVAHVTLHPHEALQSTELHVPGPVHATSQRPPPQSTFAQLFWPPHVIWQFAPPSLQSTRSHELLPLHVIAHEAASVQSIESHELLPAHVIVQSKPSGQLAKPHEFGLLQLIAQVRASRLQPALHADGHACSMQYPIISSHVRDGSVNIEHSASLLHSKSLDLVSTRHDSPPIKSADTPSAASDLTTRLRSTRPRSSESPSG